MIIPYEISLTIQIDLGDYQFTHIRLRTKYDENRLDTIRTEAMEFVHSLEHVISFEIGEVYQVQGPKNEELPDEWYPKLNDFLKKHPEWEWNALWAEQIG